MQDPSKPIRPAKICRALLAALESSEGRKRRRKRDQTPDGIGLSIKRALLERAVQEDPEPEAFEEWLLNFSLAHAHSEDSGAISAMARSIFEEWRLVHSLNDFRAWLDQGAPSDDTSDQNQTAVPPNPERSKLG